MHGNTINFLVRINSSSDEIWVENVEVKSTICVPNTRMTSVTMIVKRKMIVYTVDIILVINQLRGFVSYILSNAYMIAKNPFPAAHIVMMAVKDVSVSVELL